MQDMENQVIHTALGNVKGVTVDEKGQVMEFRGVPYGEPPVGELRWKPPVPVKPWEGVLDCTRNRPIPMQYLGGAYVEPYKSDFYYEGVPAMSEDCLYVNITTTGENIKSGGKCPVFVWFHGGGLSTGYAYEPPMDGSSFARRGIVVVSVEQRLGIFGYLALPQLTAEQGQSGNYGLMDQLLALEWVKNYISAFGGDSDNITVGGQSGGTMKTVSTIFAPQNKVKVKKIILQSGFNWDRTYPALEEAQRQGEAKLARLGIPKDISLLDLRAVEAERLLETDDKYLYGDTLTFDGVYVEESCARESILKGKCRDVSILAGCNMGEGEFPEANSKEEFYEAYRERLSDLYDSYNFEELVQADDANAYPLSKSLGSWGLGNYAARSLMLVRLYGAWSRKEFGEGAKTYAYLFSHRTPSRPEEVGTVRDEERQWSWHSSELWYMFDSLRAGRPECRNWTEWDYALAKQMNAFWANFISGGDPNGAGLPYWPKADGDMGYMVFGNGSYGEKKNGGKLEGLMADYTKRYFKIP